MHALSMPKLIDAIIRELIDELPVPHDFIMHNEDCFSWSYSGEELII